MSNGVRRKTSNGIKIQEVKKIIQKILIVKNKIKNIIKIIIVGDKRSPQPIFG